MVDRDYEADGARKDIVEQHYKLSHINQTYDFVSKFLYIHNNISRQKESWCKLITNIGEADKRRIQEA